MIKIELSKNEFEYDIRSLVKAFYPEETLIVVKMETEETEETEDITFELIVNYNDYDITIIIKDPPLPLIRQKIETEFSLKKDATVDERKNYKNILKKLLYRVLEKHSGKSLSWGTLTGIRPTKIPMKMLEEGLDENTIKQSMQKEYLCTDEKINLCVDIAKREHEILSSIDYENGYSIYIGIPFCPSTCLYCSFTSYSMEKYREYVDDYLAALFREIDFAAACFKSKKLITIYLGGGTPTTLTAQQLEQLLVKIKTSFSMDNMRELTVEAGRPDSITIEKLIVLKRQGVTRISINPQTMNQDTLDLVGRKHTVNQIIEAFHMARETGHNNINMDIILSLPGESCHEVRHTLKEIDKLRPDSLTVHTLSIKRAANLNIFKEKYESMAPTDTTEMLSITRKYAESVGYLPYYLYRQKNMADNLENIGYSMEGKEGIYNILIMEEKHTIMALGAGASSKFVFPEEGRIERSENVKSIKDYIERVDEMIHRKKAWIDGNHS